MPAIKISRRALSGLPRVTKPTVFYDTDLTGFGLRAYPSGALSWVIEYRPGAGGRGAPFRRLVLGTPKTLTPGEARKQAAQLLAKVRLGADPSAERTEARKANTVCELMAAFLNDHIRVKRKRRTAVLFDGYVRNHIQPAIGNRKAPSLTRETIEQLHRHVGREHPVTANRLVALIGAAYEYGLRSSILPPGTQNPARQIEKFREERRERYLTASELLRLGDAIREAETTGIPWPEADLSHPKAKHAPKNSETRITKLAPHAAAALRLLIFTGARLREILDLKWEHVDLERGLLFLSESKTGKKTIVLGGAAIEVLVKLDRVGRYVIFGADPNRPRADLQRPWALIARRAGIEGVRLHDLRHSYASVGAAAGLSLPIIGKLLGHSNARTTERYAHLASDPIRRAADTIGSAIAKAMGESLMNDEITVLARSPA
jgi:integrase